MTSGIIKKNIKDETIILGMDTTAKECSICITRDNKIISEYNFLSNNDLSSIIIQIIDFLLKKVNLKITDIDAFGIGAGPGIFTGIRVGMATVKGLVFDSSTKIVPVNILRAIALKYIKSNEYIVPLIDAKRDQVYIAGYKFDGSILNECHAPALIEISKLNTILENQKKYKFVGSGSLVYKDFLEEKHSNSINLSRSNFVASEIADITYSEYISGRGESDIENINPLYLKRTDAEENYDRNYKKDKIN